MAAAVVAQVVLAAPQAGVPSAARPGPFLASGPGSAPRGCGRGRVIDRCAHSAARRRRGRAPCRAGPSGPRLPEMHGPEKLRAVARAQQRPRRCAPPAGLHDRPGDLPRARGHAQRQSPVCPLPLCYTPTSSALGLQTKKCRFVGAILCCFNLAAPPSRRSGEQHIDTVGRTHSYNSGACQCRSASSRSARSRSCPCGT